MKLFIYLIFSLFFYKRVCGSSLVGRVGVAYNPVPQYRFASGRVGSMGYSPMGHFFAYEFSTASKKTHFTTKEGFRGSDPACVCVFFLFYGNNIYHSEGSYCHHCSRNMEKQPFAIDILRSMKMAVVKRSINSQVSPMLLINVLKLFHSN